MKGKVEDPILVLGSTTLGHRKRATKRGEVLVGRPAPVGALGLCAGRGTPAMWQEVVSGRGKWGGTKLGGGRMAQAMVQVQDGWVGGMERMDSVRSCTGDFTGADPDCPIEKWCKGTDVPFCQGDLQLLRLTHYGGSVAESSGLECLQCSSSPLSFLFWDIFLFQLLSGRRKRTSSSNGNWLDKGGSFPHPPGLASPAEWWD